MTVVCDTSPVSNLAAIGQLPLLQRVYSEVVIPQSVADEVAKVAQIYPQAASVAEQSWIQIQVVQDRTIVERLQGAKLDAGEAEAIALALQLNAELLVIDEQLGRAIATREGLTITGLLGTLLEAKEKGFINLVKPLMNDLITQAGFRIGAKLYQEVLRLTGEEDKP